MPFARQALESDLEYSAWSDQRVLDTCAHLTPEELARDLGCSHRNIIETLFHFYDGERFWIECLRANALPPLDTMGPTVQPSVPPEQAFATLQQSWPGLWSSALQWFSTLSAEDLTVQLTSHLAVRDVHLTRWQILRHMINHSTMHRGQVIAMLRMLGKQPPDTNLMSFYLRT
jgi:uncharacterized damage-inducible protein DinB